MTDEMRLSAAKIIDRMAFSDSHQPVTDDRRKTWLANKKARIEQAVAKADEILTLVSQAPAEGAGDLDRLREILRLIWEGDTHQAWTGHPEPEPSHDEEGPLAKLAGEGAEILNCLRARSSAPESLGNLLAVIHRDGGHRTLEVGVERAAAEAEKIVADLLSSAPEAREPVAWAVKDHADGWIIYVFEKAAKASAEARNGALVRPLYVTADPSADKLRIAVADIAAERQRQIDVEGWSSDHDDKYDGFQMSAAAACYAGHPYWTEAGSWSQPHPKRSLWPWKDEWWKPSTPRRDLVKAGALIVAEIERLDRQSPTPDALKGDA